MISNSIKIYDTLALECTACSPVIAGWASCVSSFAVPVFKGRQRSGPSTAPSTCHVALLRVHMINHCPGPSAAAAITC